MRLLAVETSTPAGSVALIQDDGDPRWRRLEPGRPQTETLLGAIDRLLADGGCTVRELDGFAVAVGPGAFIGVRVGIATMKGLAMGTDRPVVPVSTLEALAIRALEPDALGEVPADARPRLTICPLIDARRREVYAACYRPDLERGVVLREGEEMLISPTSLVERLTGPMFFLGDGVGLHRAAIVKQLGSRAFFPPSDRPDLMEPSAVAVGRLAGRRWTEGGAVDPGELTAVYFRPAVEQIASPR